MSALVLGCALTVLATVASDPPLPRTTQAMLGRWDVTVTSAKQTWPGWFELQRGPGRIGMRFVPRFGPARWVRFSISGKDLAFEPYGEQGPVYRGRFNGSWFEGSATSDEDDAPRWVAVRAPRLDARPAPRWGAPVRLFNGHDLQGWHPRWPDRAPAWSVSGGALVAGPSASEIVTDARFRDFRLHLECRMPAEADGGIYLRGRYEIQLLRPAGDGDGGHCSLYGFEAPKPGPPATDDDGWHAYDITLVGRRLTLTVDGSTVYDGLEVPGITGGALDSDERAPGPVMLQAERGAVEFRDIVLTPAR